MAANVKRDLANARGNPNLKVRWCNFDVSCPMEKWITRWLEEMSCPMEKWIHKVGILHKIFYNLLHNLSESHKVTSVGKNLAVQLQLQCFPWILWEQLCPVVTSSVPVRWLSM